MDGFTRVVRDPVVLLPLVLGLLLAGCASPQPNAPARDAGAAAERAPAPAAPQTLRVRGGAITFAQIALPVAREAGFFDKYGLDVEIGFGGRIVPSLIAGELDLITGSIDDVLVADLAGADLVIVATMVPYLQHKFMVRPEIRSMVDLRDKAVGIARRGTVTHSTVRLAAKRAGLDADRDLTIIETTDTSATLAALASGTIFGTALVPPYTDAAERIGAYTLYDFPAERIEYTVASVTATRDWLAHNETAALGFLRALAEAVQAVHTQPEYVAQVYARWAQADEEDGRRAVALAREVIPVKMLPSAEGIRRVQEALVEQVPAAATAEPTRFFDDRYIKQLDQEGFYTRLGVN